MAERPEPGWQAPDGYHHEAREADPRWRLLVASLRDANNRLVAQRDIVTTTSDAMATALRTVKAERDELLVRRDQLAAAVDRLEIELAAARKPSWSNGDTTVVNVQVGLEAGQPPKPALLDIYRAAGEAYDRAINRALRNPPGSVGLARIAEHPAFRAAAEAAANAALLAAAEIEQRENNTDNATVRLGLDRALDIVRDRAMRIRASATWMPAGPDDENPGALVPGEADQPQPLHLAVGQDRATDAATEAIHAVNCPHLFDQCHATPTSWARFRGAADAAVRVAWPIARRTVLSDVEEQLHDEVEHLVEQADQETMRHAADVVRRSRERADRGGC